MRVEEKKKEKRQKKQAENGKIHVLNVYDEDRIQNDQNNPPLLIGSSKFTVFFLFFFLFFSGILITCVSRQDFLSLDS